MALDRYQMATQFQLEAFERKVSAIEDVRELRRLAVKMFSTNLHQQKVYEALMCLD